MFEGSQPTLGLNNIMIEDEDLERYKIATIQIFGLHLAITLFLLIL